MMRCGAGKGGGGGAEPWLDYGLVWDWACDLTGCSACLSLVASSVRALVAPIPGPWVSGPVWKQGDPGEAAVVVRIPGNA